MASRNSTFNPAAIATAVISTIAVVGLLTVVGCSSSTPPQTQVAQKVAMHFNLAACQQVDVNLYKCPAVDKPICNPDYNGNAECVRMGPNGSVFVQSGFAH